MKTEMQKTIDNLEIAIDKLERLQAQSRSAKQKEERMHLSYIEDMCTESLDPETMDKWQEVKKVLKGTRELQ